MAFWPPLAPMAKELLAYVLNDAIECARIGMSETGVKESETYLLRELLHVHHVLYLLHGLWHHLYCCQKELFKSWNPCAHLCRHPCRRSRHENRLFWCQRVIIRSRQRCARTSAASITEAATASTTTAPVAAKSALRTSVSVLESLGKRSQTSSSGGTASGSECHCVDKGIGMCIEISRTVDKSAES